MPEVLGRKRRLFEPLQPMRLEPLGGEHGIVRPPFAIDVQHQRQRVGHRAPSGGNGSIGDFVQFDRRVAFAERSLAVFPYQLRLAVAQQACVARDRLALCAAQQAVQRRARRLARDVPERDVEPGKRVGLDTEAAEDMQPLLHHHPQGRYIDC